MIQPELLSIPFARDATSGTKNDIPDDPNPTLPAQTATWALGFPAVTMQPLAVGGIPPLGQDFNGVLNAISEHTVYQNAGGMYLFDQALANSIGGYPKGAVLMDDAKGVLYASLMDSNTTNFNTTPASIGVQWKPIAGLLATEEQYGTAKIATQTEVDAGTIDNKIVTPKKLRFGFRASFGGNEGYLFLPSWLGGFGFQWGLGSVSQMSENAPARINFPVPFPTKTLFATSLDNGFLCHSHGIKYNDRIGINLWARSVSTGTFVATSYIYFAVGI